jgi:hypothetical protein
MKRFPRSLAMFFVFIFLGSLLFSSCRLFMGDPRKNCNHPDHGKYVKEQHKNKTGF